MGLTIDYQLSTQVTEVAAIRRLVGSMRDFARQLPFEEVGQVLELKGPETHFERGKNDRDAWFKIKSGAMIKRGKALYLLEREVTTGVYGVLWYKGTHFDQPSDATLDDCIAKLDAKKPAGVVSVVGFDLSFSVQASKK
jgi:hypothetical protein